MKRLAFLLLLIPFLTHAQQKVPNIPVISIDSVQNDSLERNGFFWYFQPGRVWRFHEGDDMAWANPDFNDSAWDAVYSTLRYSSTPRAAEDTFSSIGWLRLPFIADTSIIGVPLALRFTQYGASEIYLDGKKLITYGSIRGRNNTLCYDPQYLPFMFTVRQPGRHVLAVRYANYNGKLYAHRNYVTLAGFGMQIWSAKSAIAENQNITRYLLTIYALIIGFFMAFCLVHLFLYIFYRAAKSNLYFSLLCCCFAVAYCGQYLNRFSHNPAIQIVDTFGLFIIISIGSVAFSGFTNYLFSANKLRFRIIAVACILTPFVMKFNGITGSILCIGLASFVFIEAMVLTIKAIIKKVKGARILGFGILLFAVFFLSTIIFSVIHGDLSDAGPLGQLFDAVFFLTIFSMPLCMSIYLAWDFAYINRNLKSQLQRVELLSKQSLEQQEEKKRILEQQNELLEREVAVRTSEVVSQKEQIEKQHEELKTEKQKSDNLLLNILPAEVADELKEKGHSKARLFNHVTVLFTDFVDFTKAGERMAPDELVDELHACFKAFDEIMSRYGIEKIKTIGDAYLAVCGLPEHTPDHAQRAAAAALDIVAFMKERRKQNNSFEIRVGIHSGSVVAGIVGVKKFAYDVWGDTVNTAARLEQHSEPGKINISESTYDLIKGSFTCTYRGKIEAKNKGELSMYFINGTLVKDQHSLS